MNKFLLGSIIVGGTILSNMITNLVTFNITKKVILKKADDEIKSVIERFDKLLEEKQFETNCNLSTNRKNVFEKIKERPTLKIHQITKDDISNSDNSVENIFYNKKSKKFINDADEKIPENELNDMLGKDFINMFTKSSELIDNIFYIRNTVLNVDYIISVI